MEVSSKQRLVKNTIVLYIRTLITMVISLFTSRVILRNLGVEDYGVYNVVGGFVSMFAIISSSLTGTVQRYLTYEIGKKESSNPQKIFGISMNIHIALSAVIVLLLETFGLWFLNTKLNINADRLFAANCVFQFSIIAFVINLLSTPYNALIIAHEKMKAFAYISLLDAILKLLVAYIITITLFDRLIIYAFLLLLISILIRFIYSIYCKKHFPEARYCYFTDKTLYKEIFSFTSMNFIGAASDILCNQGVNLILNMFFGVSVNAARAIAFSVQSAVTKFVGDFTTALKPQIIKEYASGNIKRALDLSYMGSKFSFFLMLLFSLPLSMRAPYLINIWLGMEPEYTSDFVVLTLITSSVMALSYSITTIILANGNLKVFTFWIGGIRIAMLPFIVLFLTLGATPQQVYYIVILFEIFAFFARLIVVQKLLQFNILFDYIKSVLLRLLIVSGLCIVPSVLLNSFFDNNFKGLILETFFSVSISLLVIYFVGLTHSERNVIKRRLLTKYS